MFRGSPSALSEARLSAPLLLSQHISKFARTSYPQVNLRCSRQRGSGAVLLFSRTHAERTLFYTPAVRDELDFRQSFAWPATFDNQHRGPVGSSGILENTIRSITRAGIISRGFKTRAPITRKVFSRENPAEKNPTAVPFDDPQIFHYNSHLSKEDQVRLLAFAEGFHEGKASAPSNWSPISMARDIFVLSLFTGVALYLFYGTKFKTMIIGAPNEVRPEEINVKFDDVIGVEETKQELQDVVDFLKNPKKFSHLGGRLPKGVLLVGPPGTGKTLLARAVAGEAGVPFFHAAGPEFDEMLVGQGARRMRDLFSTAKVKAPCVIFIDEIDSVGGKRSNSTLHPYANQTINQLLSEMDGFRQNEGVIVLGATNRREDLDQALLRPGRFDIEVQVPPPDLAGRTSLLEYYLSKVKVDQDVDVHYLARGTIGFTGAAIENMVNQAALRSAIDGKDTVSQAYLEDARDKVLMGPERKSRIPDYHDKLITAYHEAGHALVAYHSEGALPIHKVTIRARGSALGHTSFIPSKDENHLTKSQILARIASMLGGKVAEELIFGTNKVTTGAASDLQEATELATNMVKFWGMSEKVGDRFFKSRNDSLVAVNDLSNQTSEIIDQEIKRTLHESRERAKDILKKHHTQLKLLAEALIEYETLDAKQVQQLLETGSLNP